MYWWYWHWIAPMKGENLNPESFAGSCLPHPATFSGVTGCWHQRCPNLKVQQTLRGCAEHVYSGKLTVSAVHAGTLGVGRGGVLSIYLLIRQWCSHTRAVTINAQHNSSATSPMSAASLPPPLPLRDWSANQWELGAAHLFELLGEASCGGGSWTESLGGGGGGYVERRGMKEG